ncbi:BrnA antitoxin family protein [Novosphingobium clariflavum]|uniref:BrnA antitoxin family protein n=1 Tax=Novosphingobium clariflavum TaxID=2029884 RepID=A0ABV6S8M5_9SPHN|nr:BrnA antitoxin family protein [Novosphingobium clariflavum]
MSEPKITQADIDAVSDNPELTEEQIRSAVPFAEAFPHLAKTMRVRGAQKAPKKVSTTIRLSPEVVDFFKKGGPGWQSRIDDALRDLVAKH